MRRWLLSVVLVGVLASGASAVTLLETTAVVTGLYNVYAPTVLGARMWLGGWLTEADVPDDKIYRSDLVGSTWTWPVLSFQRSGWAVNDPSVIDWAGVRYMYFTALPKSCTPQPDCFFTENVTGLASSVDGGATWTDQGTLIPKQNGISQCGAWSPSALIVAGEVWLYYHAGNPAFGPCEYPSGTVFRARFSLADGQPIDTVVVTVPLAVTNPDVSRRPDGLFVMVANSVNLTRLHRFTSPDGLTWTIAEAPLVDGGTVWLPTPHVTWVDGTRFDLWFGFAGVPGNFFIRDVHRWRWLE